MQISSLNFYNNMNITLNTSIIEGCITPPPSKSCMQRALALSLLSESTVKIISPDYSNDSLASLKIIKALGANVDRQSNSLSISNSNQPKSNILNAQESGLAMRMFCPIACLFNEQNIIKGSGSLQNRPMQMIVKPLQDLGVTAKLTNGTPPIMLNGKLQSGNTEINGNISSQFLTGLLLALPKTLNNSTLHVSNLKSKAYIDLTIEMLNDWGAEVCHNNYEEFYIKGNQQYNNDIYHVEKDWSSAAFMIVAGAIAGRVDLKGLNLKSKQADIKILDAIKIFGAKITQNQDSLIIEQNQNNAFDFDATNCPDLFPSLCVLATQANNICTIKGVNRLKHKESDRAKVLQKEFGKLGVTIKINDDFMQIHPTNKIKGSTINPHNDHRIAMSGALLSLPSNGDIIISNAEVVKKSYPNFFKDFLSIAK